MQRAFHRFASYNIGYVFGARTQPGEGPSTDLIAMSEDLTDPIIDTSDPNALVKKYSETLRNVKLALPVNLKAVIKMACDKAQKECETEV